MKPLAIEKIETLLGRKYQFREAPAHPDMLTGLMVYKKGQSKYSVEDDALTGLNLAGLELTDEQWRAVTEVIEPEKIRALHLGKNQLKSLHIRKDFSRLQYLEVSDNPALTSISLDPELERLERMVVSDNDLRKLSLQGLRALKYLDASRNKLDTLSFNGNMPELECLTLSNNEIKNIDVKCLDHLPRLKYWYLDNNPLNQSLLVHYDKEGSGNNYLASFKELRKEFGEKEGVQNQEYKVIIVGDGTSGKTCLVNRLMKDQFIEEDSTHGISVQQFTDPKAIFRFPYVLNLWDFGGQDIYHATHRLFLQSDAVYLLVWNKRTEEEKSSTARSGRSMKEYKNQKLEYWMRYIHAYGKGSPVLVVQTRKEDFPGYVHPKQGALTDQYKPLLDYLDFVDIDSKLEDPWENGFEEMMNRLRTAIRKLGRKEDLPPQWVAIKQFLEDKTPKSQYKSKGQFLDAADATMDYQTYYEEAKKLGVDDPKRLLTHWLVPIGTVFYREGYFDGKIILNQEWAIRAIYTLYERNEELGGCYQRISDNDGKLTGKDLATYWAGYGEKERALFIDFMLACGMCYEVKKDRYEEQRSFAERRFIAPEMLPAKRPESFKIQEAEWKNQDYLKLRYDYDFPYYSYFQQFLVRTQADAQEMIEAYRYGIHIYDSGVHAIIEFDEDRRCIEVTVSEKGKTLLDRIRNRFKDIHPDEVKTMVGVGENPMKNLSDLEHLKGQALRASDRLEAEGFQLVEAGVYSPFVLLDEKNTFEESVGRSQFTDLETSSVSAKIYFSYAWRDKDNPERELLVDDLYNELKAAGFDVQRDKENCGYGEYISDFMRELGRGQLIVVFLSRKYFRSVSCMTELLSIADKSDWDKAEFRNRILPVQVEPIDFFGNLDSRKELNRYWLAKAKGEQEYIDEFKVILGDDEKDQRGIIIDIPEKLSRLVTRLSELNRGSIELYRQDNFGLIKGKIQERLFQISGSRKTSINYEPFFEAFTKLSGQVSDLKTVMIRMLTAGFGDLSGKTDQLFEGIEDLQDVHRQQQELLRQLEQKNEPNIPVETLERVDKKLDTLIEDKMTQLPGHIVQLWREASQKPPMQADVKGKLKLKFNLIPFIAYEKEISLDLKNVFKDIMTDIKNGNIFTKTE